MVAGRIHYEVFGRRKQGSGWILEMATEDRAAAVDMAEDLMANERFLAAKVTKETLNEESREFASLCILSLSAPDAKQKEEPRRFEPLCVQPQDLYTLHARERIGQLLDDGGGSHVSRSSFECCLSLDKCRQRWLARRRAQCLRSKRSVLRKHRIATCTRELRHAGIP